MAQTHPTDGPVPQSRTDPDHLLDRFEAAWRSGQTPRINDYLQLAADAWPAKDDPGRRTFLEDLITIDLEYRWRHAQQAESRAGPPGASPAWRPHFEDYVQRHPELGPVEKLSCALIGAEYRVRQRWGDRPSQAEYAARFPWHGAALLETLCSVDAELAAERAGNVRPPPVSGVQPGPRVAALSASTALVDLLRQGALLSAEQLGELTRDLCVRFPEARALSRELIRRDWMTPYQANQLLQGRGQDLTLGAYVILERLGEGGAGQVFKARHQKINRLVALKVIRKELLAEAEVVARFYREIQIVSQLSHPNVVHAYDAGPAAATHFLAMEYVEGTDLGRLVKRGGPLPVEQAREYIRQAALGLQHAHERGLVHRDIKPHNLMMSVKEGRIKVADLGLARLRRAVNEEMTAILSGVKTTGTLTPENAVLMGTADYLAPEQALDFHGADIRADIYSLGCTFYFLLTGHPPFAGGTLAQKVAKLLQAEPPAVEQFRRDLPSGLASVLRTMMAKRPEDRYQTPAEVATALATVAGPSWPRIRFPRIDRRRRRLLLAGLATALLGGSSLWLTRFLGGPAPSTPVDSPRSPPEPLDTSPLPTEERFAWQPPELVAVLGTNRWRHWGPARCLAIRPDGEVVASGGDDGMIHLWDRATGTERLVLPTAKGAITALAFAPDGKTLASVAMDGFGARPLSLWDLASAKVRATFPGHKGLVTALVFSADGKTVASAGDDKTVKLWKHTGELVATLDHAGAVRGVAFAPDGQTLATAGDDPVVTLWDLATHAPRATLAGHKRKVLGVAFARDGKTLASASEDHTVKLWNVPSREERATLPGHAHWVNSVAFARDGRLLASGSTDRTVRLWDVTGDKGKERAILTGHSAPVHAVAFTPDGNALASAGEDGVIGLWDVATGKQRTCAFQGHRGMVLCVAIAPDGRTLASSSADQTVRVWDLDTGTERAAFETNGTPWSVAFAPGGDAVAHAGNAGGFRLRRLASGAGSVSFAGHKAMITAVAVAPDGKSLVSTSDDRTVKHWDVATQRVSATFEEHRATPWSVAYSPVEPLVASGSDGTIILWDVAANKKAGTLTGHKGVVNALAFAPDGKTLASAGSDRTVKLWHVSGRQEMASFTEHKGVVRSVVFSPDGETLAEAGDSGQIILRRRTSGEVLWERQLPGPVRAVAFAPDGRYLATANSNGTIYLLRLPK